MLFCDFFLKSKEQKATDHQVKWLLFFSNKSGHNNTEKQHEEGKCAQLLLKTGIWKSFSFI